MTWQPIETAPRQRLPQVRILGWNGKTIDLWVWDTQAWSQRPRACWRRYGARGISQDRKEQPTHWMPLPEPPEGTP